MLRRAFLLAALAGTAGAIAAPALGQQTLPPADAVAFESLDQVKALAAERPTIVYFHAEWCPTCQATMVQFQARWPEVQPGIVLVLADYDKETELKSLYGVTYQNTYVQVDEAGERLQIWNGGGIEALNDRPIFPS
jgi:thioredoxin 1